MIHSLSATIPVVAAQPSAEKPSATQRSAEKGFSLDESEQLQSLKQRDREVRTHEQAHIAAGGQHVLGGAF